MSTQNPQSADFEITSIDTSGNVWRFGLSLISSTDGNASAVVWLTPSFQTSVRAGFREPSNAIEAGLLDYRIRRRESLTDSWISVIADLTETEYTIPGLSGDGTFQVEITPRSINGYGTPIVIDQGDLLTVTGRSVNTSCSESNFGGVPDDYERLELQFSAGGDLGGVTEFWDSTGWPTILQTRPALQITQNDTPTIDDVLLWRQNPPAVDSTEFVDAGLIAIIIRGVFEGSDDEQTVIISISDYTYQSDYNLVTNQNADYEGQVYYNRSGLIGLISGNNYDIELAG